MPGGGDFVLFSRPEDRSFFLTDKISGQGVSPGAGW